MGVLEGRQKLSVLFTNLRTVNDTVVVSEPAPNISKLTNYDSVVWSTVVSE